MEYLHGRVFYAGHDIKEMRANLDDKYPDRQFY